MNVTTCVSLTAPPVSEHHVFGLSTTPYIKCETINVTQNTEVSLISSRETPQLIREKRGSGGSVQTTIPHLPRPSSACWLIDTPDRSLDSTRAMPDPPSTDANTVTRSLRTTKTGHPSRPTGRALWFHYQCTDSQCAPVAGGVWRAATTVTTSAGETDKSGGSGMRAASVAMAASRHTAMGRRETRPEG